MIITWNKKESDIIERIIADVKKARFDYVIKRSEAKSDYDKKLSDICVKECEEELEFLEKLKKLSIEF